MKNSRPQRRSGTEEGWVSLTRTHITWESFIDNSITPFFWSAFMALSFSSDWYPYSPPNPVYPRSTSRVQVSLVGRTKRDLTPQRNLHPTNHDFDPIILLFSLSRFFLSHSISLFDYFLSDNKETYTIPKKYVNKSCIIKLR